MPSEKRDRPRSATSLRPESQVASDLKVPERPTFEDITDSRKQINAVLTELGSATFQRDRLRADRHAEPEDMAAAASRVRTCESTLTTLLERDVQIQCVMYALDRETPGSPA